MAVSRLSTVRFSTAVLDRAAAREGRRAREKRRVRGERDDARARRIVGSSVDGRDGWLTTTVAAF
jgi:hypothetical protein